MSDKPVTQEELELAMQSFEQMGGMTKYTQMIKDAMEALRENFDAIESALRMTQALHDKQLQGIDHWIGMCKFLLPMFVAIATAGLTITVPSFNSRVAVIIGMIGFVVFFAGLFEQSRKRQKLLIKQEQDIEKLNKTFQDGQELMNILKAQAQDERGEMTDEKLREQLEKTLKVMNNAKGEA